MARRYMQHHTTRSASSPLFGDPAWYILIELFIARLEDRMVDRSNAYRASRVPTSTGHRWVMKLERAGHVYRRAALDDGRRGYIIIGDAAMQMVATWLWAMFGRGPAAAG